MCKQRRHKEINESADEIENENEDDSNDTTSSMDVDNLKNNKSQRKYRNHQNKPLKPIDFNIVSIENRLKANNNKGHQHINRFLQNIYDAFNDQLHIGILNIISLYSNHKQVCAKWHEICDKLGGFGHFIKTSCSINDITQFERKLIEQNKNCSHINLPCALPDDVRVSLMICNGIKLPIFDKKYPLNPIHEWTIGQAINSGDLNGLLFYCGSDDGENIQDSDWDIFSPCKMTNDNEWYPGMNVPEYIEERKMCLVNIGFIWHRDDGDNFNSFYSLWNPLNDSLLIGESGHQFHDYECSKLDFEQWITLENVTFDLLPKDMEIKSYCDFDDLKRNIRNDRHIYWKYLKMPKEDEEFLNVLCDEYVLREYKQKYNPLIHGYIRYIMNNVLHRDIPLVAINSILLFFPFFQNQDD